MNNSRSRFAGVFASLVWLLCCLPGAAFAADMYSAQIEVADESGETRNRALGALLGEVLTRVTGDATIGSKAGAAEILAAAPSLVQQYRYQSSEVDGVMRRELRATFDRPAVERMLRERGLPLWSQRPSVVMWLAVERAGRREMLNLDQHPQARSAVQGRARQRGLPLQLPLMDLEDQTALSAADLWSDYHPALRAATARYPHEMVLAGRVRELADGSWTAAWSLVDRVGSQGFQTAGADLATLLGAAIDQVQDLLVQRFAPAVIATGKRGTLVEVTGVDAVEDYAQVLELLSSLDLIGHLALRTVDGDDLLFELGLRSTEQALANALDASPLLWAEPRGLAVAPPAEGYGETTGPAVALRYRLRR